MAGTVDVDRPGHRRQEGVDENDMGTGARDIELDDGGFRFGIRGLDCFPQTAMREGAEPVIGIVSDEIAL